MPLTNVKLAPNVVIHHPDLVNLYNCTIGASPRIGSFVEIQKKAEIGENCKISSHTFICEGVKIGDGDCDWPAVMRALAKIKFSGWATAEVGGGDAARLKDISQRMDRVFSA